MQLVCFSLFLLLHVFQTLHLFCKDRFPKLVGYWHSGDAKLQVTLLHISDQVSLSLSRLAHLPRDFARFLDGNFIQTLAQRQISTDCQPIYRSSIDRLSTDILTAISVACTCSKHDPIFLGSKKALVTSHLPLMIIMICLVWKLAVIFMERPQLLKKKKI